MRNNKYLLVSMLVAMSMSVSVFGSPSVPMNRLGAARDSLVHRLHERLSNQERMRVITNLSDVYLALNNDSKYVVLEWEEGLRFHDANAIIDAGTCMTLRFINDVNMDSADVWMDRCEKQFVGSKRKSALAYLHLMRDIRLYSDQSKMAAELIYKRLSIERSADPYQKMVTLFKLGTLALTEWNGNETLKMKPWNEYMEQGYKISKSLPLSESYNFRRQFLMALCFESIDYTREFISFLDEFRSLPEMKNRPFYSHKSDMIACARMFGWSNQLSRQEVDSWFRKFCYLTSNYPYDCQAPYNYYFYAQALNYYLYTRNNAKIIECCDSAIINAPKYKLDNIWYFQVKGETLASMGKWKEAYENSLSWVAAKDSVSKVSSAAKLMELQTQYKVDHLEFEKRMSILRFVFASIVSIMLLALLVILYRHYRILRNKNRILCDRIDEYAKSARPVEVPSSAEGSTVLNPSADDDTSRQYEEIFALIEKKMRGERLYADANISRTSVVEMLGINKNKLNEAIQACTGFSYTDYLTDLRLHESVELLGDSQMSVNDVAYKVGYGTYTSFYRAFMKRFGVSPTEYRRFKGSTK